MRPPPALRRPQGHRRPRPALRGTLDVGVAGGGARGGGVVSRFLAAPACFVGWVEGGRTHRAAAWTCSGLDAEGPGQVGQRWVRRALTHPTKGAGLAWGESGPGAGMGCGVWVLAGRKRSAAIRGRARLRPSRASRGPRLGRSLALPETTTPASALCPIPQDPDPIPAPAALSHHANAAANPYPKMSSPGGTVLQGRGVDCGVSEV